MQFGIDPLALITAVVAIWFAIRESRRNNSVILEVEQCEHPFLEAIDENNARPFHQLRILIRNRGVVLFGPELCLTFLVGTGTASMTIKRRNECSDGSGQFQRGMIAEFSLKSYELRDHDIQFLCQLDDMAKQRAALCVFSQGYLAKAIPVVRWSQRIKSLWNMAAEWVNYRQFKKKGAGIQISPADPRRFQLGTFATMAFPMERFVESLRKGECKGGLPKSPPGTTDTTG